LTTQLNLKDLEISGASSLLLLKTCADHGYELNEFIPLLQRHLSVLLNQVTQIQRTMRDPLTGVSSRRFIEEKLQSAMLASKRWQHPLAVMFVDIDNFKQINDHYGHAVGDQVLQQVGKRLIEIVGNVEYVARLGGEEFVVVCDMPTTTQCDAMAQRLLKAFYSVGPALNYPQLAVTASIGLANFSPQLHHQPYQLIESADIAMYQAKRAGKNRVFWYKAAANDVMDTQLGQTRSAHLDKKMNSSPKSMCEHD
jgi:diguanylate cyclase (GGDEF)-like protein